MEHIFSYIVEVLEHPPEKKLPGIYKTGMTDVENSLQKEAELGQIVFRAYGSMRLR